MSSASTPFNSNSLAATPNETPVATPPPNATEAYQPLPAARDIHMILSDVDGTLFTSDHELHHKTLDAIRYIRKTRPNLPIIPVTGKQRVSCAGLIKDLGLEGFPAACLHGAIIYDKEGNIEAATYLDPAFVVGVTALMKKHNKTTMLYVADSVAMCSLETGGQDWEAISRGFDPMVTDERDTDFLDRVLKGTAQIGKIFLPMDEELVLDFLDTLRAEFPNTPFKTTRALPYIIEIVAETVDKSAALAFFCDKYNIKEENVITFGDGENDVGMLTAAGFGVSMGNAMDAPKEAADYATATNDEGGVGEFLDKVFRPTAEDKKDAAENLKSIELLDENDPLFLSVHSA